MAVSSEPIVLVGLPGSGKSTVGPIIAERLGRRFVDLDQEIERHTGRSVAELFSTQGEVNFRTLETELTGRLASEPDLVLAPGGGWIMHNRLPAALLVWLDVTPTEALQRLGSSADERPLLRHDAAATLARLLAERQSLYRQADLHIETNGRTAQEVAALVLAAIEEYGNEER